MLYGHLDAAQRTAPDNLCAGQPFLMKCARFDSARVKVDQMPILSCCAQRATAGSCSMSMQCAKLQSNRKIALDNTFLAQKVFNDFYTLWK